MGMLNLSRFGALFKAQPSLPGFPQAKPAGFKPPKFFDPAREQGGRGYKLGTVRRWKEGPHIKTTMGWLPYNAKKGKMQRSDGKWVDLPAGFQPKEEVREYPPVEILEEASDVMRQMEEKVESGEMDEKDAYRDATKMYIQAIALLQDIANNHPRRRVADRAKKEFDYRKQMDFPQDFDGLAGEFLDMMEDEDYNAIVNAAHKRAEDKEERKKMGAGKVLSPYPETIFQKMAEAPKSLTQIGEGKSVNTVFVRESPDGTESIFKIDALGTPIETIRGTLNPEIGSATREAAAFTLDRHVLGLGIVPPTALISTELPDDEDMLDIAAAVLEYNVPGFDQNTFLDNLEEYTNFEASVQMKLEGASLSDIYMEEGGESLMPEPEDFTEEQLEDMIKIAVLDYVTGNTDRHLGNMYLTHKGRIVAIDNGLSFPDPNIEMGGEGSQFKSVPCRILKGTPIPDSILEQLGGIDEGEFKHVLHQYRMHDEAEGAWERLQELLQMGEVLDAA